MGVRQKFGQHVKSQNDISMAYQPIGKLLWVKLPENGNIVRLRCKSVVLSDENYLFHKYEGADGRIYNGNAFALRTKGGDYRIKIYDDYNDCLRDILCYSYTDNQTNKYKNIGTQVKMLDVIKLLNVTYGCSANNIEIEGCWNDNLYIHAYFNVNGTIKKKPVAYTIWIDNEGAHISIKEFDEGKAFPTYDKAFDTYKPTVIDFKDNNDEVVITNKTTITITITEEQRIQLKNMGLI